MPPATAMKVAISTRRALRADQSIIRAIIGHLPQRGFEGSPQVAFGVDKEVCGGDGPVAFGNALLDLDEAVAAHAGLHGAWLEAAGALVHDDELVRAAIDHSTFGNGDYRRPTAAFDDGIRVHVGPQDAIRVGKLDADAGGARILVEHGVDEADFACESAAGIGARGDGDGLALLDQT